MQQPGRSLQQVPAGDETTGFVLLAKVNPTPARLIAATRPHNDFSADMITNLHVFR